MFESFRAVITEVDKAGVSTFRSVDTVEPIHVRTPLTETKERTGTMWQIWGTPDGDASLLDPAVPVLSPGFPGPGGTRFAVFSIPPDSWATDRSESTTASGDHLGIANSHGVDPETGDAAFHATASIDYLCVIKGELVLELDEGRRETLTPGTCVVQRGTNHAWRNIGTEPAVLVSVLVGAHREATPAP